MSAAKGGIITASVFTSGRVAINLQDRTQCLGGLTFDSMADFEAAVKAMRRAVKAHRKSPSQMGYAIEESHAYLVR